MCCVFWPVNGCFACRLLSEIICFGVLTSLYTFLWFFHLWQETMLKSKKIWFWPANGMWRIHFDLFDWFYLNWPFNPELRFYKLGYTLQVDSVWLNWDLVISSIWYLNRRILSSCKITSNLKGAAKTKQNKSKRNKGKD